MFYNFRADRARQLTKAFIDKKFKHFKRNFINNINFISMTNYDSKFHIPVLYKNHKLKNCISEIISNYGLRQLKIAETEKYPHVTYFFNGGIEKPFLYEDRILIESPKIRTYDLKPEMSANEITIELIKNIRKNIYSLITVNFANMDMLGHTGKLTYGIKAVEILDKLLTKIYKIAINMNNILLITADHGNIEYMLNQDGTVNTSHTNNPV